MPKTPPLRIPSAKVEGRDTEDGAKNKMKNFKSLTKKLLNIPKSELIEQEEVYRKKRKNENF